MTFLTILSTRSTSAFLPPHAARLALAGAAFFTATTHLAAQGVPGYVIAPLSLMDRSNQATIRATVNGQRTMLVVDTGAPVTVLDSRFYKGATSKNGAAKQDELPPELRRKIDANGQRAEVGIVSSLKVGVLELNKRPVVVTDLGPNLAQYNNYHASGAIAGLLGEDILRQYGVFIDWRRRGVYFNTDKSKRLKLGPALVSAGWTAVPMSPTNENHYSVACVVEDKPVRLIVDTGSTYTSFSPGIVKFKNMLYNRDTGNSMAHLASTESTMSMIGGDARMFPARIEHWKIGSYEIASSVVAISALPAGVLADKSAGEGPVLGLLGAEVLAKNNAFIDIAGSTLYLKPGKS